MRAITNITEIRRVRSKIDNPSEAPGFTPDLVGFALIDF